MNAINLQVKIQLKLFVSMIESNKVLIFESLQLVNESSFNKKS